MAETRKFLGIQPMLTREEETLPAHLNHLCKWHTA